MWPFFRPRTRRPIRHPSRPPHRPRLEALEDRLTPATFTVTSTTDGEAGSLRAAILAANATPGDNTIILPAGDYQLTLAGAGEAAGDGTTGDLDIQGNLTIQGDGSDTTTIDALRLDRVFEVLGGNVTISGVTIENGQAQIGGGLLNQGGTVTLSDCDLDFNLARPAASDSSNGVMGGAIASVGGALVIQHTTIERGIAFAYPTGDNAQGGGIYIIDGALTVTDNSVLFQSAARGGTVASGTGGNGQGGAIYAANSTATLTNSTIDSGNLVLGGAFGGYSSSGDGQGGDAQGGGIYANNSTLTLTGCTIIGHAQSGGDFAGAEGNTQGGGIYAANSTVIATKCAYTFDTAFGGSSGQGGGIYTSNSNLTLTNCAVSNDGAREGGGIFAANSALTITHCDLSNDNAFGNSVGQGGGIYAICSTLTATNCTLDGDTARGGSDGGDAYLLEYVTYVSGTYPPGTVLPLVFPVLVSTGAGQGGDAQGGGIYVSGSSLDLTNCTLNGDTAVGGYIDFLGVAGDGQGGGIFVVNSALTVNNCAVTGDTAQGGGGGGLLVGSETDLVIYATYSNTVTYPVYFYGGVTGGDGEGGGIYALDSTLTMRHDQVTGDDALGGVVTYGTSGAGFGGGLDLDATGLVLKNSTFSGDLATTAGNNSFVSP
jgi:hypothetical protein